MKTFYASTTDRETGNYQLLVKEYPNKDAFRKDISANGYALKYDFIFSEEQWNKFINEDKEFMTWFQERLDKQKRSSRISYIKQSVMKKYGGR